MGVETLSPGTNVRIALPPAPAGVQWFKAAMFWEETSTASSPNRFSPAADIVFELWDTCAHPLQDIHVLSDYSYGFQKRMVTSLAGGECLEMRFSVLEMPANTTRKVYYAGYYHSGAAP
jgi:hypothetical protein